jgi:acyl CoA:acetate/3-ketoacid CoA transferase alpha subunit
MEAVERDEGDTLAMEGFVHLIPPAAGHEMIRQRRGGLAEIPPPTKAAPRALRDLHARSQQSHGDQV